MWGFPMGCEGAWRAKVFPWKAAPPFSAPCTVPCPRSLPLGEREEVLLPPSTSSEGLNTTSPHSDVWLHESLRCLLNCLSVLCWFMKVFLIVSYGGEFKGKAHFAMMLMSPLFWEDFCIFVFGGFLPSVFSPLSLMSAGCPGLMLWFYLLFLFPISAFAVLLSGKFSLSSPLNATIDF